MPARRYALVAVKLLLAVLALLVVLAIGGVLWLKSLDTDAYRHTMERELSGLLGREVSVGAMSFELSLRPTLSVRGLRIANPGWASRTDFLTAGSGEARIDVAALLRGHVGIDALRLADVDLLLERDAEGAGNWTPGSPARSEKPAQLPDFETVALARARIGWRQRDGSVIAADIDSAEAAIVDGAPFRLQAEGRFRGTPIRLDAKADSSLQAALRHRPWQLALRLAQQDAALALDLRMPSIDAEDGIELRLEATGQHLASWAGIAGRALPDWGPYSLSARSRIGQGRLDVSELKFSLDGLPTQPARLQIDTGTLSLGGAAGMQLSAAGSIGDAPLSLEAHTDAGPEPAQAGGAGPLKLDAVLAGFALSAEGRIGDGEPGDGLELALRARGDAGEALRTLAGVQRGQGLPVDLTAQLVRTKEGYALQALSGRLLGVPVNGHLDYASAPRASLTGTLELGALDLGDPVFAGFEAAAGAGGAGASAAGGAQGTASAPPAASIPPAASGGLETDLSLRIAALAGLPFPATDLAARLLWRDGELRLPSLAATLAGTRITGEGTVRRRDGRTRLEGRLDVPLLDLAKLGGGLGGGAGGGSAQGSDSRAALDKPLPLSPLRALDADLRLDVARIAGAPAAIEKVAAQARLERGRLGVGIASATVAGIAMKGGVDLDASGEAWRIDAHAEADRIDLAALGAPAANPSGGGIAGTIADTRAVLGTEGKSARELLANARLSVQSAPFSLRMPGDGGTLAVDRASIEAAPGAPVRLSAEGTAFGAPATLTASGGTLAELAEPASAWPRIEASLRSTREGQALQVDASTGPLRQLVSGRDLPLAVQASAPGMQASLEGTVRRLAAPGATPLSARIEIADLAQAAKLFTTTRLPSLQVQATGRITAGDGQLSVDGLSAQAGRSDATGQLRIRWRDRPTLSATLTSRVLDLRQWEGLSDPDPRPPLDRPIPVPELLARDLQLQLRAQRIQFGRYDLARLQLDGGLQRGLLQLSAWAAEGNLHGDLRLDVRQLPALALRLELKDVDSRSLYTGASRPAGGAAPLLSVRAQLSGSGNSLRRMLGTSNGTLLFTAGPGTLPMQANYGFERLAGNLLFVLMPGRPAAEFNQLECAAARFDVAKGIATSSDGIVLRLQRMDILGSGAANLGTGEILFGYRAVRRSLLSMSLLGLTSGIARVTGTLSEPKVELDPSGVLLAGTAAWATAGVSLLAGELWRKLEATGDPCSRIAEGAQAPERPLGPLLRFRP